MKYQVKIAILSFFTLLFSVFNLTSSFICKTTDNTEKNAIFVRQDEKISLAKVNKNNIKTVKMPISRSLAKNRIDITGRSIPLKHVSCEEMPTPNYSSANYCSFRGSSSIFIFGHNTNSIFGSIRHLKRGQTFQITFNGKTTTYRVTENFAMTMKELSGNNKNELRFNIFSGTYLGRSDITIQTCEGHNDTSRRYIKAVRV